MANKIKSPEDLKNLRDKFREETELRTGEKEMKIIVHMGTCGIAAGARDVLGELADQINNAGLKHVAVQQSGCAGLCDQEPMVTVTDKSGVKLCYGRLDKNKVRQIVQEHIIQGKPVTEYVVSASH